MFVHEVYPSGRLAGMIHYRLAETPGKLAVMTELGRTGTLGATGDIVRPSGLIVPGTESFDMPELPTESIHCADERELVAKGVDGWKKLLRGYDSAVVGMIGVHLVLRENRKEADSVRPSGLIVASDTPADSEFQSYTASAEEIAALERMTNEINAAVRPTDPNAPGNYL